MRRGRGCVRMKYIFVKLKESENSRVRVLAHAVGAVNVTGDGRHSDVRKVSRSWKMLFGEWDDAAVGN